MINLFGMVQVFVFRFTHGNGMAFMRGMPILLLNTVGRKSGKKRTTPLMFIRDGDNYVITASNNGSDKHPAWYHNIKGSAQIEIEVPGKHIEAVPSIASEAEKERLWPQLVALAPFFDGYRKGTSRSIPMILLRPC
jgi:deazaflavin-dependent oxidoreductase (nitroreductase family)